MSWEFACCGSPKLKFTYFLMYIVSFRFYHFWHKICIPCRIFWAVDCIILNFLYLNILRWVTNNIVMPLECLNNPTCTTIPVFRMNFIYESLVLILKIVVWQLWLNAHCFMILITFLYRSPHQTYAKSLIYQCK